MKMDFNTLTNKHSLENYFKMFDKHTRVLKGTKLRIINS